DVVNSGVMTKGLLDLGWRHVLARDDHELLRPPDEVEVLVGADVADIAGADPPTWLVRISLPATPSHVEAAACTRAAEPDLAGHAFRAVDVVLVDDANARRPDRPTDRSGPPGVVAHHRLGRAGLGQPIHVEQRGRGEALLDGREQSGPGLRTEEHDASH